MVLFIFLPSLSISQNIHPALIASAYEQKSMLDSAIFYYTVLMNKNTDKDKWLIERARLYINIKNFQEAMNDLLYVEKIKPGAASYFLAKLYALQKDTLKTIAFLSKNLNSSYKVNKGEIFSEPAFQYLYQTAIWKELWAKEWYSKSDYQEGEIRYLFKIGQYLEVINTVVDIEQQKNKLTHRMKYWQGMAYAQMQNLDAAITCLTQAIEMNKKQVDYFYNRALCYIQKKQYKKAINDLTTAIALNPGNKDYYYNRALAFSHNNQLDEALNDINILVQLFPEEELYQFLLGRIAFDMEKYILAISCFNRLIEKNPSHSDYLFYRARCYTRTNMTLQAIRDYTNLIENFSNSPSLAQFYYERGNLYYNTDNKKNACIDWRQAEILGHVSASQKVWENCQ